MKEKVKIAIWGFGAMGQGIAQVLLRKQGVEVCGVCDIDPQKVGKSIFEVLNSPQGEHPAVEVRSDIEEVLATKPQLCILATDSFTSHAFPKLKLILEHGIDVISTAEEMSYPQAQEPELAQQLDKIAKENGATVLGTGINPGMMMDLLAICLSGCMTDVEHIVCKRVNSLSPFGPTVMKEQGVGITVAEFEQGKKDGTLAGHVGFAESVAMISDALGLGIDNFRQDMEAIVTTVDRRSPHGFAKAGDVAGVNMTGFGSKEGQVVIEMIHPQQIEPEMEGTHTGDYITLSGSPAVNMSIKPEVDGGIGTIAMCVNMIPHVINAEPGLKTMLDLPVPRAIMGDFRNFIK